MSRFELAEAAHAIPDEVRSDVADALNRQRREDGPLAPLWEALHVLVLRAGNFYDSDEVTGEAATVVRVLRGIPPQARSRVAFACLDAERPELRPLLEVIARLLGRWSW